MIKLFAYTILSFLLTGFYRSLALRYRWLDHPNSRSSHTTITPRGAGLIFASLIVGAAWLQSQHQSHIPLLGGIAVMLIGWWDDIRNITASTRCVLYAIFSGATIALIGEPIIQSQHSLIATAFYVSVATLGLMWLINLYNFMDGINGLATLEAIFVLLGIHLVAHDTPYAQTFSSLHFFSCAVLTGFLLWNFPKAKIFMGDAGSAFLGFFFGTLILISLKWQGPLLTTWLILFGIFIVDTGYTLMVRIGTSQNWSQAHRLHAYQLLTTRLKANHTLATSLLMIVNMCWLLPIAWLVQINVLNQIFGLALAYLPLVIACHWLKAGIPRRAEV